MLDHRIGILPDEGVRGVPQAAEVRVEVHPPGVPLATEEGAGGGIDPDPAGHRPGHVAVPGLQDRYLEMLRRRGHDRVVEPGELPVAEQVERVAGDGPVTADAGGRRLPAAVAEAV